MKKSQEHFVCFVVDDAEHSRALIGSFLRQRNHTVCEFSSAEDAWRAMESQLPDIIFLDWMLPSMSGVDFCRRLRTDTDCYQPLVVMVTAKTESQALTEALDAGADEYIRKPFDLPTLAVRTMVVERRAADRKALYLRTKDLADRQGYLEALSGSICAGILVVDEQTNIILDCNQFAAGMIGRPAAAIIGKGIDTVFSQRGTSCQLVAGAGERVVRCKARLLTESGERTVLKNEQGLTSHGVPVVLETFIDIADLEKAEEELSAYAGRMEQLAEERAQQLIHADRLALLGTMSAGLAHEVNNCITLIGPNAQMLERYLAHLLPEEQPGEARWADERSKLAREGIADSLTAIRDGVRRASALLSNLKKQARKESGGKSLCQPGDCVKNALLLCHNNLKYGITVEDTLTADLPAICVDEQQIEQVLVNLINNSAQAMDGSGKLRLSARAEAGRLFLKIEDNGPGIPPEAVEKIWEPFYTTKAKDIGTGLGLPICRGILQAHDGGIRLALSELGGAAFELFLPTAPASAAADA